jgi:hypothetical protein
MSMSKRVDRYPRCEIEIAVAVGRHEPSAVTALERKINPRIGRQQMGWFLLAHRPCNNEWK